MRTWKASPEYRREWRKNNKRSVDRSQRRWRKKNRSRWLEYQRSQNRKRYATKEGRDALRRSRFRRKYGITLEDYDRMFERQKGLCAICKSPEQAKFRGVVKRLFVDHDHKSNRVRQLLCQRCNFLIGLASENAEILGRAISYLKRHSSRKVSK